MREPPLLSLRHITKSYPGVRALRDVSLDLHAGEVHALLGENGAGKSTLIKILTGLTRSDPGGTLAIGGTAVSEPTPRRLQELGVAAVYQNPTLFDELSVAENLTLGTEPGFISWRRRRRDAQAMLDRVGTTLDLDQPAGSLRMAEKQLLEIARALARRARVLVLDEPTAALPQDEAARLLNLVAQLRREGTALLYISHRLEEVLQLADRLTILRDGQKVGEAPRGHWQRADLIRLMAGRQVAEAAARPARRPGPRLLEVQGLRCAAGGLRDVSFTVHAGEIVGVAGLVGAGRTELARTLFGITPADGGAIRFDGKHVHIHSIADALRLGIAYVPEDRKRHGVIEDLPITDNISLAMLRRWRRLWVDEPSERALAESYQRSLALKSPGLEVAARTLSGGNQQKVALARWLATQPRLLMLDEPTQGIDVGAKAEIHRMIDELARSGLAILLISSELPELLALADRLLVMRRGRVAGELPAAGTTGETVLHLAMEEAPC